MTDKRERITPTTCQTCGWSTDRALTSDDYPRSAYSYIAKCVECKQPRPVVNDDNTFYFMPEPEPKPDINPTSEAVETALKRLDTLEQSCDLMGQAPWGHDEHTKYDDFSAAVQIAATLRAALTAAEERARRARGLIDDALSIHGSGLVENARRRELLLAARDAVEEGHDA